MAQNLDEIAAQFGGQAVSAPVANALAPSANLPQNANLDVYHSLQDAYKPMVNALIEGRMPTTGRNGLDKNLMTKLFVVANQIDPSFDATTFKARQNAETDFGAGGATGKKFASLGKAMNHVQLLEQSFNKLDNNNVAWGGENYLANHITPVFSSKMQNALGTFTPIKTALSTELANAFRSTGMAEADIKAQQDAIPSTNSTPAEAKGNIESTIKLLEGRFQPDIDNYNRTMRSNKTISDFITSPATRAIYERIKNGGALNPPSEKAPATNNQAPSAGKVRRYNPTSGKIE